MLVEACLCSRSKRQQVLQGSLVHCVYVNVTVRANGADAPLAVCRHSFSMAAHSNFPVAKGSFGVPIMMKLMALPSREAISCSCVAITLCLSGRVCSYPATCHKCCRAFQRWSTPKLIFDVLTVLSCSTIAFSSARAPTALVIVLQTRHPIWQTLRPRV